tara:strand:+ start:304 stop:621 length:318 start_codon:yes stop_codon:yes gene_type:complete
MKNINVNYTPQMENEIRDNSPITYDIAVVLAEKFGKKLRSVIAKACSMDKVEYIAKERVAKNGSTIVRKSEMVESIAKSLATDEDLTGLEKATKSSLDALMRSIS